MPAVLEKTPDAPLLMSLNIMRHLGATIDLQQMSISFKHICRDRVIRVPLFRNASGQLCMSLFGLSKMSTNPERLTVRKVVGDECYLFHTTVMGTDEGNSKVDSHDVTSSNYPENVQNSVAAAIKLSRKSFESSQDISIEPTSNHVRHLRHGGCSYQQERTSRSLVEAEHERTEHHDSSVAASGVSGPFGRSYEEHSVADDDSRNAHPRTDEFLHMQHMVEQAVLRCKQQEKINKEKHKQERMGFWAIPPRSWRTRVALRQQKAMEGRSRVQQAVTSQWGATQWWNRSRTKTRKRKRRRKTRQSRKWIFTASAYVDWQWQNLCVARRDPTTRGNCPRERGRQCDFFMTEEGPVRGDESQSFCQTSQTQRDSHSGDRIIGGQFRCGELAKEECCPMSTRLDGLGSNGHQVRQTCKKRGLRIVTNKKTGEKETYFVEINQFVKGSSKKWVKQLSVTMLSPHRRHQWVIPPSLFPVVFVRES